MKSKLSHITLTMAVFLSVSGTAAAADQAQQQIDRGRYLIKTAGCNDCHTPAYPEKSGLIPEQEWLTGNNTGFSGPWGVTYPVNLRNYVKNMSESQWMARVRKPMRPPMPWFALRDMSDMDLQAIYAYLRAAGPKGDDAPAYLPPGQEVQTPYIEFFPKNLPLQAMAKP